MFFTEVLAQGVGATPGGSIFGALLPWLFILVIFYFLLIRPQQKRVKNHRSMCDAVSRGDTVVTQGGLVGKVTKVAEDEIMVEISEGVKVRVIKSTISDVRVKGEKTPTKEKKPVRKLKKKKITNKAE